MQNSQISVWKSFPLWIRLSIIYANNSFYKGNKKLALRFLSLFQTLVIIFCNARGKQPESYMIFQPLFNQIQKLTDLNHYSNFTSIVHSSFAILGILALYFLLLLMAIFRSAFYIQSERKQTRFLQLCSGWTTIHVEILFYPISYGLMGIYNEIVNNWSLDYPIPKGGMVAIIVVLLCLNVLITFYKLTFCYCRIKSKDLVSRKSSIHLILIAALKLLMAIFQAPMLITSEIQNLTTNRKIICTVLCFTITFGILIYNHIFLPEYNFKMIKMHLIFDSVFVAISAGQIVDVIIGNGNMIMTCAFLMMPLWIKMNFNISNKRLHKLLYHPEKVSNINYCVQAQVLYNKLEADWQLRLHDKKFPISSFDANWIIENKFTLNSDSNGMLNSYTEKSKLQIKLYLENFLRQHPSNSLATLAYAQLILESFQMYPKAYDMCRQLRKRRFNIPDQISVYNIFSTLEGVLLTRADNANKNNAFLRSVEEGMIAENLLQDFGAKLNSFTSKADSFWRIFKAESLDILALYRKAEALEKQRILIESDWKRFELQSCAHVPLALLLYGVFKAEFLNLPYEGGHLINRYNWFVKNKGALEEFKMNMEEYGSVAVSGEKKAMGNIMACSDIIAKMFGIGKETLINRSVNGLMPRFFKERHDQFILNYYETGQYRKMKKEIKLYGKDKDDNIFPISILLTIHPSLENGIVYISFIKKIKDQNEYILFREDGLIEETSCRIRDLLGIKPYQEVYINEICSDYNRKPEKCPNSRITDYMERSHMSPGKGYSTKDLDKSQIFRFQQPNDELAKTFTYQTDLNTFKYGNNVLTVMTLKPSETLTMTTRNFSKILASPSILHERTLEKNFSSRGFSEIPNENNTTMLQNEPESMAFKNMSSFRNFDNNTERKLLDVDKSPRISLQIKENRDESSCHHIESGQNKQEGLCSVGRRASSVSSTANTKRIDKLQKLFGNHHPDKFRNIVIFTFVLLFTTSIVIAGVQFTVFQQSIDDINFAINAIRQSYDRLTSLVWAWRYSTIMKTRIEGIVSTSEDEMNMFKTVIRTNRDSMKLANDELADTIVAKKGSFRELFLENDINIVYQSQVNGLNTTKIDTFQAINLFVSELMGADTISNSVLLTGVDSGFEFVRINGPNDMLSVSENLIQAVESYFKIEISKQNLLIGFIFYLNLVLPLFLIFIIGLTMFVSIRRKKKLVKAMLTIDHKSIDHTIHKASEFQKTTAKKGHVLVQKLYDSYLQHSHEVAKPANCKLKKREYVIKGIVMLRMKQGLILILLIFCFSMSYSIGYLSYRGGLQNLVAANDQVILASKATHYAFMPLATAIQLIASGENATMRNHPITSQIVESAGQIITNQDLYNAFTDESGRFIDPAIQNLFLGKPCAFVVNFPGSQNAQHCQFATQNDSIGLFAVNSDFQNDALQKARELVANTSLENRQETLTYIINVLNPKSNTLVGGYMYLTQIMTDKFNQLNSSLKDGGHKKLAVEIILMCVSAILCTWFVIKKVLDDYFLRICLKVIPYQEILKNKFLQSVIKELYNGQPEIIKLNI